MLYSRPVCKVLTLLALRMIGEFADNVSANCMKRFSGWQDMMNLHLPEFTRADPLSPSWQNWVPSI
jgi:hypothetical protein